MVLNHLLLVSFCVVMKPVFHTNLNLLWSWNALGDLSDVVEVARDISISWASHLVSFWWSNVLHVLLNYKISIVKVEFTRDNRIGIFSISKAKQLLLVDLKIHTLIIIILLLYLFTWIAWILNSSLLKLIKRFIWWHNLIRELRFIVSKRSKSVDHICEILISFLELVVLILKLDNLRMEFLLLLHPLLFLIDVQFNPFFPVVFIIVYRLSLFIITFLPPMEKYGLPIGTWVELRHSLRIIVTPQVVQGVVGLTKVRLWST